MRRKNGRSAHALIERLVRESMLVEADVEPFEPETHRALADDSIDEQIDNSLRHYEIVAQAAKNESIAGSSFFRRFINEADDDEAEGANDEKEHASDLAEPSKLASDSIDVQEFAGAVGRLIDGFVILIEIERAVFRRAHNFLLDNYDSSVADSFDRIMRKERMLDDDESERDIEEKDFAAPPARGAGYDVGGGA